MTRERAVTSPDPVISLNTLLGAQVETRAFTVPDGRTLAYSVFGDDGPTIMYFHGAASCRFEAASGAVLARQRGVRIIAPDRPGYGRSSPASKWTMDRWAEDVRALADRLAVDRFAVAGASAGGPFGLAVAAKLRERVSAVHMINTAGSPFDPAWRSLPLSTRFFVGTLRFGPGVARRLYTRMAADPVAAAVSIRRASEAERRLFQRLGEDYLVAMIREGFIQGPAATVRDIRLLYNRPWTAGWSEVAAPIVIHQGSEDLMLPFCRAVARAHPRVTLREIPGGHLGGGTDDVWEAVFQSGFPARSLGPRT